jgi:pimeloyl-ACP methyl ester carboxylesterase
MLPLLITLTTATPMEKPTAIMIHGAGGGGWEYHYWEQPFKEAGFDVIAPDLLPNENDYAKTTFPDYLTQITAKVKNKKPLVLIGASMGGILVLKSAETIHPDLIILINSVPPKGIGPTRESKAYPPIIEWENGPIEDTRASLPDGDEATVQWAHPQWRNESGAVLNAIRLGIEAKKPTCPVLVVIGDDDTDIPAATSRALAAWASADTFAYAKTSHIGPLMGHRRSEIANAVAAWCKTQLRK